MSELDNTTAIIRKLEPLLEGLTYHELTVLNKMVVERIRLMHKAGNLLSMSKIHVGDRVSLGGNGWRCQDRNRHTPESKNSVG